jgi:hypothetical protein
MVITLPSSILVPIPLYAAAHSLAYAQSLKNWDIYDSFEVISVHNNFMFAVYRFNAIFLVWEPTPIELFVACKYSQ